MARGSLVQAFEVLTTSEEAYQTPTQLVKALIQKAQFVNTGGVAVTIDAWITPDSATVISDRYKVIDTHQIGDEETFTSIELIGEYINSGGKLIVQASALGVTCWVNGNTFKTET